MRFRSHHVLLVAIASIVLASASAADAAPVAFDGVTTCAQNFGALASTGTTAPWADDSTIPAWYAWTAAPSNDGGPANYTVDAGANVVTGNDNTLAIDDRSVAPVPAPEPRSAAAAAVLTAAATCLAPRVRRRVRPV